MDHSRSLEMAPFDRSHTSSYSASILSVAVSCCIVFKMKRDTAFQLIARSPRTFLIFVQNFNTAA